MTVSPEQTADALWTLYQTMPEEVQTELKKRITRTIVKPKSSINFRELATKGWADEQRTYGRDELYD